MAPRRKKLIEVALPLEAINNASIRESYIYRGNPSALHKWWAQRPLAAARAVIFAQMVDDPSEYVGVLRDDPNLRRRAERVLRAKMNLWKEAQALARKVSGTGIAVPEPGPEPTLDAILAETERQRLFGLIEELVAWESTNDVGVLSRVRDEISQSWRRACAENAGHPLARELYDRNSLPPFCDPFAGGGTLPMEAQRLGLDSHASDLNPVAVLINTAILSMPQRFAGGAPVNPDSRREVTRSQGWHGKFADGLAEDVRYYGEWIRNEAVARIGDLYPQVEITDEMAESRPDLKTLVGLSATVVGWLWARTVASPDPAFANVHVPLASTFLLSTKVGREFHVAPFIDERGYTFVVKHGRPKDLAAAKRGTKLVRANFQCLMSGAAITGSYIKAEGKAGRIGMRLMATVVETPLGRVYLTPTADMEVVAKRATPAWTPDGRLVDDPRAFTPILYGLDKWSDLFTARQMVALTTFSDLAQLARTQVIQDAVAAGMVDDGVPFANGGRGATAYADSIAVYLSFVLSKASDYNCSLVPWYTKEDRPGHLFSRQAISMVWDFVELNPLSEIGGALKASTKIVSDALAGCAQGAAAGHVAQGDAVTLRTVRPAVFSTDPPYYDNIPYADLSDFFYVWLRRTLRPVFPDLFATLAVPKMEELVAAPYRHGGESQAEDFFLGGMTKAMRRLAEQAHPAFPVTIYYAFKQSETDKDKGTASTGWDTFLEAVLRAGFMITGTWPMRTERGARSRGIGSNALASSIVLVCRPRPDDAATSSRREFIAALRSELPSALAHLQSSNIAPADLAQASIGPGMAIFSRYESVLDAEGAAVRVRDALVVINQILDETLAEQEGDFDADSRFALAWFEQYAFGEGPFGTADVLARAKVTSVDGLVQSGIARSGRGQVRLLKPNELNPAWDPDTDARLSAWEVVHQLIRCLGEGGEAAAASVAAKLGAKADIARELAYRLFALCERRKRAPEALAYNGLVQSWPEITRLAREKSELKQPNTPSLFDEE